MDEPIASTEHTPEPTGHRPESTPSLTVVIPTFNRVSALRTCLEHLERQSCTGFEVIVVDDGSTDDTPRFLAEYPGRTSLRLRCLRQQNNGPSRARNWAIQQAQAPVVLMIGDDIFGGPAFIETHLQFHRQHPAREDAALGLTRWSTTGQTVTPLMAWLDEGGFQFSYHDLLDGKQPGWEHFYTSNLSLKTALLRENPFHEAFTRDRWMMEDLELGYRLEHTRGLRLSFLPEALAEHLHPTTLRKTCARAFGAGLSARVFHELWPELKPAPSTGPRSWLAAGLHWRGWLLKPMTWVTERVTRLRCPNPLLRPLLRMYAARGYRMPYTPGDKDH
ncbi:glycosyltransferase family 2 protein [Granulicella rosea]|uniref:glycosyltransferase family 2 protein n=1 Tax=Granulicella rosea TaxID=474952 RepID=UPI001594E7EE|nr:glycosyltransferase [Granulicella rosea]